MTAKVVGSGALFGDWDGSETLNIKNAASLRNTAGIYSLKSIGDVKPSVYGKLYFNAAGTSDLQLTLQRGP